MNEFCIWWVINYSASNGKSKLEMCMLNTPPKKERKKKTYIKKKKKNKKESKRHTQHTRVCKRGRTAVKQASTSSGVTSTIGQLPSFDINGTVLKRVTHACSRISSMVMRELGSLSSSRVRRSRASSERGVSRL